MSEFQVKFLVDMGISPETARWLRDMGYDAVHLHEQGLERLNDEHVLGKARDEGRVLLTHDLGFGQLLAASGAELPSVIVFRLADMRPPSVNRYLEQVLQQAGEDLLQGAIISVREDQIRIRQLPIESQE